MLSLLLWSALGHLEFGDRFCQHDKYLSEFPVPEEPKKVKAALLSRDDWEPMRVILDTSKITASKLGEGESGEKKLKSLRKTFDNLEDFYRRLLKVSPEVKPIFGMNADLVIRVSTRNFPADDKTLGVAWQEGFSSQMRRPNKGAMDINPRYIPEVPQDENSLERLFFTVIFHEIMHVLGITHSHWNYWIDSSTGKKYDNPVSTYTDPTYNKTFRILHTPALHRWAEERFGVSYFAPGVPAGMEIEDGGGSGTAGSHPESRIYMSEVMCGIFVGYVAISNLSLSALEDTGWYTVNYSMAEPYAFGDGKSMQRGPLRGFPNKAPHLSFPEHYLCWDKEAKSMCHHDFRSKAYCSPVADWKCPGSSLDDVAACRMKKFVNPKGIAVRGDREEFDYLYFKVGNVSERCEDVELNKLEVNDITGETYGTDSMCAMSTLSRNEHSRIQKARCHTMMCDKYSNIMVKIDNQIKYCVEAGQQLNFDGFYGYFVCPDPRLLCGMKMYLNKTMADPLPTLPPQQTQTPVATKHPVPTKEGKPVPTEFPVATDHPAATEHPQATLLQVEPSWSDPPEEFDVYDGKDEKLPLSAGSIAIVIVVVLFVICGFVALVITCYNSIHRENGTPQGLTVALNEEQEESKLDIVVPDEDEESVL